jgi:membrane protease YdiL (CAAX protease family)
MINWKHIITYLVIAFVLSWACFLAPLAFKDNPAMYQQMAAIFWVIGMWGPAVAAMVTTVIIAKEPFSALRLNTIGPKRYYAAAWFIPPLLAGVTVLVTALIGTGQYDPNFTTMKQMTEQAAQAGQAIPVATLIVIQLVQGLLLGPVINLFATMGEEIGWRGFLLPRLMPLGTWKALILSGIIWGLWHAPVIIQGYNYPQHPYLGVLLMTVFCVLIAIIFGWLYLRTGSPWVAGIAHGSLNAWGGLPLVFLIPGFDTAIGGTLLSVTGWLVLGLFIAALVGMKAIPTEPQEAA